MLQKNDRFSFWIHFLEQPNSTKYCSVPEVCKRYPKIICIYVPEIFRNLWGSSLVHLKKCSPFSSSKLCALEGFDENSARLSRQFEFPYCRRNCEIWWRSCFLGINRSLWIQIETVMGLQKLCQAVLRL